MAALLDDLNQVTERMQPYLQQYHQLMRDDPVLEADVCIVHIDLVLLSASYWQ
jgi:hypothetical protein